MSTYVNKKIVNFRMKKYTSEEKYNDIQYYFRNNLIRWKLLTWVMQQNYSTKQQRYVRDRIGGGDQ